MKSRMVYEFPRLIFQSRRLQSLSTLILLFFIMSQFGSPIHAQMHDHPLVGYSTVMPQVVTANNQPSPVSTDLMTQLFGMFSGNKTRFDQRWFYIESTGMPNHQMMVGITNWQQQVPLPQPYTGHNAWQIPLKPVLADKPISGKHNLMRGAIAVAVNGVPIFNALNNRGEDAFLIGELDEFGGHCGRADDYHYHAAPLHLVEKVGRDKPIAFALDGYPIYGLTEPDGSAVKDLDSLNGHFDAHGNYHYHASKTYPYINGGMRGVVQIRNDEVTPQAHTTPVRPAGRPLRGAEITDFKVVKENQWSLTYRLNNVLNRINYQLSDDGKRAQFQFVDSRGQTTTQTYTRSERRSGPPPQDDDRRRPPRRDRRPQR